MLACPRLWPELASIEQRLQVMRRWLVSWPCLVQQPVVAQAASPSMPEHALPSPGRVPASAMADG